MAQTVQKLNKLAVCVNHGRLDIFARRGSVAYSNCLHFHLAYAGIMARSGNSRPQTERIIGIDPGSVQCGVGIIERQGRSVRPIHWETISCGRGEFSERLRIIYDRISELCVEHAPDRAAIEGIFHYRNADSALKLGHARGVALLALTHADLSVQSFQPAEIKRAVGSYGAAGKDQVRLMVCRLLRIEELPGLDASDGLAIALTAAFQRPSLSGDSQGNTRLQKALNQAQARGGPKGFQARVKEAIAKEEAARRRQKRRTGS